MKSKANSNLIIDEFISQMTDRFPDFINHYNLVSESLIRVCKTISLEVDKFKILPVNPIFNDSNDIPIKGIFTLTHEKVVLKQKQYDPIPVKKSKKNQKITFEPEILEKFPISLNSSQKMKIVLFNPTYEKIIRYNIIEWMYKMHKIDEPMKSSFMTEVEESWELFRENYIKALSEKLEVDIFDHNITDKHDVQNKSNIGIDDQ